MASLKSVLMNGVFMFLIGNLLAVSGQDVAAKFADSKIVPNIIPKAPTVLAKVSFPRGKTPELGTHLRAKDVREKPTVTFPIDGQSKYVLLMIEPNPVNTTNHTQHWLVSDIQTTGNNHTHTEYLGTLPCHNGSRHFVVLVFKQGEEEIKETHLDVANLSGRINFNVNDFARKYSLGVPIAGNFFEVNSGAAARGSIAVLVAAVLLFLTTRYSA